MTAHIPPHSVEAEEAVLCSLLLDNEALHRISLPAEAFYGILRRQVYEAILALAAAGHPFDVITVYERMKAADSSLDLDALVALNAIAQSTPGSANIRRYAAIVAEKHMRRQMIAAADEFAAKALAEDSPASDVLDAGQMALAKLATVRARSEPQHIHQSLDAYLGLLHDLSEGKNPAIPTGISGFDRLLNGGLRRGEMMVIGARPKHGKTALTLAMARNMARDFAVLFISQEMPVMQLMHRHTAAMGSVDLGRILAADAKDSEMWGRVSEAAHRLGKLNLVHDEQAAQSLMDVRRKAVGVKRSHGLDVLFVDFLQLMQGGGEEGGRNRELDIISNGLKALALDLDIGVVLLSQMSRKADESFCRPTMTHLRDSGAIEAAADQVCVLFTDHAHPLSPKLEQFSSYSELEIVAHRNGPQGLVPLHFAGQFQQITDWGGPVPQKPTTKTARSRGMSDE